MRNQKSFIFKVKDENIAGMILSKKENIDLPKFVYLHGAGIGQKERVNSISLPILNSGINILAFDFSGHGESTGELKKSSLQKRVNEAKEIIDHFASKEPLTICGSSMGGYVSIKLLEHFKIDTLILFCPALYDKNAYSVRFDEGFTEILRSPESWKNTDVLSLLENFTGKLLIIIGEKDEVIPKGVIDLINNHTPNAKKKEIYIIPNCPHRMIDWLKDKEAELNHLHQKITEYLM